MKTMTLMPAWIAIAITIAVAGCAEKDAATTRSVPPPVAPPVSVGAGPATETIAPSAGPLMATVTPIPTGVPSGEPDPADSAAPPARRWDCGARGQRPCPMQGWMKRVMGPASASADAPKLAEALSYAEKRVPPGYSEWAAIAGEGAARARRGDVEGAKASCRRCHEKYKRDYRESMRDRVW